MALPAFILFLPKLLPAAKLAYDHRDKAVALYQQVQNWRKKDKNLPTQKTETSPSLSAEEQISELRKMILQRDDIISEQSNILAKLANDVTELSNLTDRLRRRSVWLWRIIYLALLISIVKWFLS